MIILTDPIQDVHGHIYDAAVVVVSNINYSCSKNMTSNRDFDLVNGLTDRQFSENHNISLSFNALIWKDKASFLAKKRPMPLASADGNTWFSIYVDQPKDLNLEEQNELCETHLREVVLTSLAVHVESSEGVE